MEGSVKERLTGALIFVAVVVVIVPEMFSGPKPQPADMAPAQPVEAGLPLRTYSMTLNDSAEARAPAPAVPAPVTSVVDAPTVQSPPAEPVPVEPAPVAAATMNPPVPEPATSAAGGTWWLQVGIFSVRGNAERLVQKLRAAGFAIDMDKQAIGGKEMYRVRAGPVSERAEAVALQARLKASGNDSRLLPP